MDSISGILTAFFLMGGMISTPHLLIMKSELRTNGIWTSYIWYSIFSDLRKFKTLMKNEENLVKRHEYKNTYYMFIIPFIISIASFIGLGIFAFTK